MYVLVDKNGKPYRKASYSYYSTYPTLRGARIVATKMGKKLNTTFDIWESEQFAQVYAKRLKTVTNMMSGKEVVIHEDTPLCCDPSSETYWSM